MKSRGGMQLDAPPPDLLDLTLWVRLEDQERADDPLPQSRPWNGARVAFPQNSILRPGGASLTELAPARQHRTIHLLIQPFNLTCYRHEIASGLAVSLLGLNQFFPGQCVAYGSLHLVHAGGRNPGNTLHQVNL